MAISHRINELRQTLGENGGPITVYRLAKEIEISIATAQRLCGTVENPSSEGLSLEVADRILNRWPHLTITDLVIHTPSRNAPKEPNANKGKTRRSTKTQPPVQAQ